MRLLVYNTSYNASSEKSKIVSFASSNIKNILAFPSRSRFHTK